MPLKQKINLQYGLCAKSVVYRYLRDNPEFKSLAEIADSTGIPYSNVRVAINSLLRDKNIQRMPVKYKINELSDN